MDDKDLKSLKLGEEKKEREAKNKGKKKNVKKKSAFKKDYIPIIGLVALLPVLIVILVLVSLYDKKDYEINVDEEPVNVVDKLVDTSDSMCSEKEVNNLYQTANKLSVTYQPVKKIVGHGIDMETGNKVDTYGYVQKVDIRNLTEDMYLIVNSNNALSKQKNLKLTIKDVKDGVLTYFTEYTNDLITYTIKVYSSKGDCADELFREFEFKTPIYNRFSAMDICDNYPNFKYCQKYITEDRPTQQEFQVALAAYQKENKVTTANDGEIISSNLEEHNVEKNEKEQEYLMYVIVGAIALVIIIGIVVVILLNKKKGAK